MEPSNERAERGRILLWTAGVTLLLLVPVPTGIEGEALHRFGRLHGDKLVHAALFLLLARAWLDGRRSAAGLPGLLVALAAGLYGGLLELVQGAVGRDAEWGDFAADLAGAFLAWLAARWAERRRRALTPPAGVGYRDTP